MLRSFVLLASFAAASGLVVGKAPAARRVSVRSNIQMADDIVTTLSKLEGPVIFWGSEGVLSGHEESDIKGYDNFDALVGAIEKAGLADTLKGGEFTVLAPTNAAVAEFKGEITADILKYHVLPGKVPLSAIDKDQATVQGNTLIYGRRFRKTFLDSAMVGITSSGASKGQVYPVDVECSNGLIHAIDCVLVPGAFTPEP
mmetsp:Transcript_12386/g.32381  ORF Transcript_12386/g.32381 Transcript_12386/m.32381 type:complete len:200 (+) Transcript_12386:66-665(+)